MTPVFRPFPDIIKPDSTTPPPEDQSRDGTEGQGADGAPVVVPVSAATCEPLVETVTPQSGRQMSPAAEEEQEVLGETEDPSALRQRAGHTIVEY